MKFIFNFLSVIVVSSLLISCDSKKTNESDSTKTDAAQTSVTTKPEALPETGSLQGDTINLHGKFVLFYGPAATGNAVDSINAETKAFLATSSAILDSIKTIPGMFAGYTSVNNIRIYNIATGSPMIILRSSFKEPVGMIVSDGLQSPMIKKGIVAGSEYRELINKYFVRPS